MVVAPPTASRTTLRFPQRRRQRVEAAYRRTYVCDRMWGIPTHTFIDEPRPT
jgi:hypothetical protein